MFSVGINGEDVVDIVCQIRPFRAFGVSIAQCVGGALVVAAGRLFVGSHAVICPPLTGRPWLPRGELGIIPATGKSVRPRIAFRDSHIAEQPELARAS